MYTGPHIIKDNLVFGYDTGYGVADNATGTRFYPGKAVDNEFYNSGPDGTILDYVGYGGTGTAQSGALDAFGTTDNIVYRKTGKLRFGPTGGDDIGTLYYGNTYTFSIYMRHVPGETQMSGGEFDICDRANSRSYSGTLSSNMTYEWKRFSVTALHNNSSNYHFIDVGIYQGTGVFEWCCPQIELGTIASPFTSTERSSTASLIDLKETTDIDVSNVSFDSTGQPDFDGTDDYFTTSGLTTNSSASVSFETIIKFDGTLDSNDRKVFHWDKTNTSNGVAQIRKGTNNGRLMYQHHNGTSWYTLSVDNVVTSDTYIHILLVHSGTTATMYKNGVQVGTTTVSNLEYTNAGEILIGYRTSSEYWKGEIPIFKVYDKALTTAEIKQNYNAYKNRFDI